MPSAMTTAFGSAKPWRRAARFGVSPMTTCSTFPHRLANHHETRGDAYPDLRSHPGLQRQPTDLIDHCQPRSDGAFGIVLMSSRIAEIGQHPVAHELRGKSVEPPDCPDARILKPPDDLPQILRVKASRKRRRAGHVTKHDRQVAAFRALPGRFEARRSSVARTFA